MSPVSNEKLLLFLNEAQRWHTGRTRTDNFVDAAQYGARECQTFAAGLEARFRHLAGSVNRAHESALRTARQEVTAVVDCDEPPRGAFVRTDVEQLFEHLCLDIAVEKFANLGGCRNKQVSRTAQQLALFIRTVATQGADKPVDQLTIPCACAHLVISIQSNGQNGPEWTQFFYAVVNVNIYVSTAQFFAIAPQGNRAARVRSDSARDSPADHRHSLFRRHSNTG